MSNNQFIQLIIGGRSFDIPLSKSLPIIVDFAIEDDDNFEVKKGSTALNIEIPATVSNTNAMNTFFSPESEDYSPDNFLRDSQSMTMIINGKEFMIGKAMIRNAKRKHSPTSMEVDLYSNNADWAILNSELTLHDVMNPATHIFDLSTGPYSGDVDTSWSFDGTDESQFFVYAPVRYRDTFFDTELKMSLIQLRPALFLYWLLHAGFKAAGYKIQSEFMDLEYFRRMVLPWTWGNFLYIDSPELDVMKFKALLTAYSDFTIGSNGSFTHLMSASSDGFNITNTTTDGGFDNSGTYSWSGTDAQFTYLPTLFAQFGTLQFIFNFKSKGTLDAVYASHTTIKIEWYVNGSLISSVTPISVTAGGTQQILGSEYTIDETWISPPMGAGDIASVRVVIGSFVGVTLLASYVAVFFPVSGDFQTSFELIGFKVPVGGIVDFKKYPFFKSYKWTDLLRGTIDAFNLQMNSDSIGKIVYIEPTHQYVIGSDLVTSPKPGYYNNTYQDWRFKQDESKGITVENYSDYEQVFKIRMREDHNDGMLKLLSDRSSTNLTEALYQFPSRFKKGVREMENRFFSGLIHYEHTAWKFITGVSPQLICLIPENITNSSNPSAVNMFNPKLAYYKGLCDKAIYGGWDLDGDQSYDLPYMFAVNYKTGGESDPVLTYNDQNIDNRPGYGLMKRFFLQRLAIMRHGKKLNSYMVLNNSDVENILHREFKMIGGSKYQLIKINGFKPCINESTECVFWLWSPITSADNSSSFPSNDSVMNGAPIVNTIDPKYSKLICLSSDIPK